MIFFVSSIVANGYLTDVSMFNRFFNSFLDAGAFFREYYSMIVVRHLN